MTFEYPYGMPVHPGYFYNSPHEVSTPNAHGQAMRSGSVSQTISQQAGPTVGVSVNITPGSDLPVSIWHMVSVGSLYYIP